LNAIRNGSQNFVGYSVAGFGPGFNGAGFTKQQNLIANFGGHISQINQTEIHADSPYGWNGLAFELHGYLTHTQRSAQPVRVAHRKHSYLAIPGHTTFVTIPDTIALSEPVNLRYYRFESDQRFEPCLQKAGGFKSVQA
jgi:hypothetical protein